MANGETGRQGGVDLDALRDAQSIFDFIAKVPNGAVDLGVTYQAQQARTCIYGYLRERIMNNWLNSWDGRISC